jgi:uncharacterized phiE125 gp8 family phage protein
MSQSCHWALATVTASTQRVITRNEAKDWMRLSQDDTAEDALIDSLIAVAQKRIEDVTNRSMFKQVFALHLDALPGGETHLSLPTAPLVDSTDISVTTYDDDNVSAVWSTSEYRLDTASEPGRLIVQDDYDWPDDLRAKDSAVIQFKAGYSTAASGVPDALAQAVKHYVAHLYEHRGDENPSHPPEWDHPGSLPPLVRILIEDYMLPDVG